jgi:molecular chaperone DnaJ
VKEFYRILNLQEGASEADIKKAYRSLVLLHHPDKGGNPEKFKRITEAYQFIMEHLVPEQESEPKDYNNDFNEAFGKAFSNVGVGRDIEYNLFLSISEAYFGTEKTIEINNTKYKVDCPRCSGSRCEPNTTLRMCSVCRGTGKGFKSGKCGVCAGKGSVPQTPCTYCNGHGKVNFHKKLDVRIPSGAVSGSKLRIRNEGMPGRVCGDIVVSVFVKKHPDIVVRGLDIYVSHKLTLKEALLGSQKQFEVFDGKIIDLVTEPCLVSGDTVVFTDQGFKDGKLGVFGHLFVKVFVDFPKKLSPEAKKLAEAL